MAATLLRGDTGTGQSPAEGRSGALVKGVGVGLGI